MRLPFSCLTPPDPAPVLGWVAADEPAPEWETMAARLGLGLVPRTAEPLPAFLGRIDPCGLLLDPAGLAAATSDAIAGDPLLPIWLAGAAPLAAHPPAWLLRHPGFEGTLEHPRTRGAAPGIARAVCRYVTHRRAAERDPLTGLPNRAGFARWLARARAGATDRPRHLVLVDLCNLKETNRREGYEAGDRRIVAAGRAFAHQLDPSAPRGRWGGDEIVAAVTDPIPCAPPHCRLAQVRLPMELTSVGALVDQLHRALDTGDPGSDRTAPAVRS